MIPSVASPCAAIGATPQRLEAKEEESVDHLSSRVHALALRAGKLGDDNIAHPSSFSHPRINLRSVVTRPQAALEVLVFSRPDVLDCLQELAQCVPAREINRFILERRVDLVARVQLLAQNQGSQSCVRPIVRLPSQGSQPGAVRSHIQIYGVATDGKANGFYTLDEFIAIGGFKVIYKLVPYPKTVVDEPLLAYGRVKADSRLNGEKVLVRECSINTELRNKHVPHLIKMTLIPDVGFTASAFSGQGVLMEYCDKKTIEQYVSQIGCLRESVDLVIAMVEAVAKMHENGVVHGDLHAGNIGIMTDEHGASSIRILDFGAACRTTLDECCYVLCCAPAPEIILGIKNRRPIPATPEIDKWNIGANIIHLKDRRNLLRDWGLYVDNTRPLQSQIELLEANFARFERHLIDTKDTVSDELDRCARRLLSFDPHLRPPLSEVLDILGQYKAVLRPA